MRKYHVVDLNYKLPEGGMGQTPMAIFADVADAQAYARATPYTSVRAWLTDTEDDLATLLTSVVRCESLDRSLKNISDAFNKLIDDNGKLTMQVREFTAHNVSLQSQADDAQATLADAITRFNEAKAENERLTLALTSANRRVDELNLALSEKINEIEQLKQQTTVYVRRDIHEAQVELTKSFAGKLRKAEEENAELKAQLYTRIASNANLHEQLAAKDETEALDKPRSAVSLSFDSVGSVSQATLDLTELTIDISPDGQMRLAIR